MRRSFVSPAVLATCALLLNLRTAYAADDSKEHTLFCGRTRLVIDTQKNSEDSLESQVIYVHSLKGSIIKVDLNITYLENKSIMVDYMPVAFVEEWKCKNTRKAKFVELLFVCNENIGDANVDRYCGGSATEEWTRYLSLDGQLLDAGFKFGDQRYKLLWKRLGLPNLADGVTRAEVMIPVD